ncbi:MAG: AAA family ATPase [Candidatus Bathyarchaeota archaeon]|nr:AAA family ATPase [Candidatus Bathyarchaeota archaeon]
MKHRIGLAYLPGALPCFENFGNLPTDIVCGDGLVAGEPSSEVLDMLIIPGGSLVESQTVRDGISREILKMADAGKFVLGICSGFQILSRGTDIGRLSATPIIREGLGLLDVEFKPLICTDHVQATVVDKTYLTNKVGAEVLGFHCHTYGSITVGKSAKSMLVSQTKRLNYRKDEQKLVSGVANKEGNVVGVLLHSLLDQNPIIIEGITESLDIKPIELQRIRAINKKLQQEIKREIGISTNVHTKNQKKNKKLQKVPLLLLTALGSGSGKTFIVTALAAALKKRGIHVGVLKVGGDIRDLVPALYLIKEPIRGYSSIKIGESGWRPIFDAVADAGKDYDFLIVEGAMSAFTGLLMNKTKKPSSTIEVAATLDAATVVVAGCEKEGIESALVNTLNYVKLSQKLGVKVKGVIFNKIRMSYITNEIQNFLQRSLKNAGVELVGLVPRVDVEGRGTIPEVEIKYEEFGAKALEIAEQHLNIEKILTLATPTKKKTMDYLVFSEKFKNALVEESMFKNLKGGKEEKC